MMSTDSIDTGDDGRDARRGDFIRAMIAADIASGKFGGRVVTRFPPEPNGYLHIGHAKSICLNFGLAQEFAGARCNLRFDDTNPETEKPEYVESMLRDIRWLGFDWGEHLYYASDYFGRFYEQAEGLIRKGLAYVDSSPEDTIREYRGTVTQPGRPTPYRDRTADQNLDLLRRMRAGEFGDGEHVLRARIDLASPNMLMRDPILYRIRHAAHYRQGDAWCIYPLYDWAHPLEDAFECVTHSLCTLEFENNRELYDWVVENCDVECRPWQTEFARLELDYVITSKRKLLHLVQNGIVDGWDDPRMPTLAGLRRRGVTPEAIRALVDMVGVARTNSRVDYAKLEYAIRDDLNTRARRVMCVVNPLRAVITNWPEDRTEMFEAPFWPHDVPKEGTRPLPFGREIVIERDDFMEDPPPAFHRLAPGREVRLRHAWVIRCDEVVRDDAGDIVELRCTYDPETRGGSTPDGRSIKGTIHWVSAAHGERCDVRLYDRLFAVPEPGVGQEGDVLRDVNPESLVVAADALLEPAVANDSPGTRYQFERLGYFMSDTVDSKPGALVFNRIVTLRDTWKRIADPGSGSTGRPQREHTSKSQPPATPAAERDRSPAVETAYRVLVARHDLPADDADILAHDPAAIRLFDAAVAAWPGTAGGARPLANWIIHELPREAGERSADDLPFGGQELAALVSLAGNGTLSSSAARDVLAVLVKEGGDPASIVDRLGLRQVSGEAELEPFVRQVIDANADRVADYRGGRTGLMGFFIGQVMRATGGRANPEVARTLLERALG